jgi:glycosyltransferase involved in cell wall biosynthesis
MEKALVAAGASVTTATTDDDGPGRRINQRNLPACAPGVTRIYIRKWTELYKVAPGIVPWLWRNVRNFDAVHIHALFSFTSVAGCVIAWLRRVPYIIRPLGTLTAYGLTQRRPWLKCISLRLIEGPILSRSAFVHCTSDPELDEVKSLGLQFRGGVIPLGIESPVMGWEPPTSLSRRAGGRKVVLYLSRLDPKKNVEGLLRAFAIVAEGRPYLDLVIAGAGSDSYVGRLKVLADELPISGRVAWLDHVEGKAKSDTFATADVFVLPSFSENFGIAAVEAMLAGLPCILGQGVGIADQVRDAGAGLVVAPEPKAIARALAQMFDDDEGRRRMGELAKPFAEQKYSTVAMAGRLIRLYRNVSLTCSDRAP